MSKELKELGIKHGTDKVTEHTYTEIYSHFFEPIKDKKLKFLEIGAGNIGGSHKMWRDYFPNADIFCIDPFHLPDHQENLDSILEEYGVHVFKGNQLDRTHLYQFIEKFGKDFDVILDDGAHLPDAIQVSLGFLFPYLKPGGFYFVEDLNTARRRNTIIEKCNKNIEGLLETMHVKDINLQDSLEGVKRGEGWNSGVLNQKEKDYLINNIYSYQFFNDLHGMNNLCLMRKKELSK